MELPKLVIAAVLFHLWLYSDRLSRRGGNVNATTTVFQVTPRRRKTRREMPLAKANVRTRTPTLPWTKEVVTEVTVIVVVTPSCNDGVSPTKIATASHGRSPSHPCGVLEL
jgi:hypothetical protein